MQALTAAWVAWSLTFGAGPSAGPGLAEQAKVIDAPISDVVVFSDRARVRRRARVTLGGGTQAIRLPDLPGATPLSSVRVGATGAKVLRVEVTPVEREILGIEQVDALVTKLEAKRDEIAAIDGELALYRKDIELVDAITPAPPVPEKDRDGATLALKAKAWTGVMDFADGQRAEAARRIRELSAERRQRAEELQALQREVGRYNLGAFSVRKTQVLAIVAPKGGGAVELVIEYMVPGARWWPAYDLSLDDEGGDITLQMAGLVEQASGEDWDDVELSLSTAIPGQHIDVPRLLTWTLGEKREFIPRARPERTPTPLTRFAPPTPQPSALAVERAARRADLMARVAYLNTLGEADAFEDQDGVVSVAAGTTSSNSSKGRAREYRRESKRVSRPARTPRPAMAAPSADASYPEAMDFADEEIAGEVTSARHDAVRRTSLGLFDPTTWRRPTFGDATLPAMIAGGLDYVYAAPHKASIPSTGERLRVPLSTSTWPAVTRHEASPALSKTAYVFARVPVKGGQPILAGGVNIFAGRDFIGEGRLETTGPGGELRLPFGADQNVRITHNLTAKTKTEGVFSKDDVTTYLTTIEVANYNKRPITVDVWDVLPQSQHEDLKVKLTKAVPKLTQKPDAKGRVMWTLEIPAGGKMVIRYDYEVERPTNWQLRQY